MKLVLAEDDGTVIETWYIPEQETTKKEAIRSIEIQLPVYTDQEEYKVLLKQENEHERD